MLNKYGFGVNHELNTYLRSEHMENTDYVSYKDLNPIRPDAFVGFTANMFINPNSIITMPDNFHKIDE